MNVEAALAIADNLVFAKTDKHLSTLQATIFRGAWSGQKYEQIAKKCYCSEAHAKMVGAVLWELLSEGLEEKITKKTFRAALERKGNFIASMTSKTSLSTVQSTQIQSIGELVEIDRNHLPVVSRVQSMCSSSWSTSGLEKNVDCVAIDHDNLPEWLGKNNSVSTAICDDNQQIKIDLERQLTQTLKPADQAQTREQLSSARQTDTLAKESLTYPPLLAVEPELPHDQVELASSFYIEHPPIESRCYQTIFKPGALIRIKAPRQMGKTSLMARILHQATLEGYQTVPLNFQLADSKIFQDLDLFLRWFCLNIGRGLQLPNQLADNWDEVLGSKISCTDYFANYLLAQLDQPLVLALDEVDRIFQYPELADDFFGLLGAWHEEAKNSETWKKLRLVVVHSTEAYLSLNINQSPFNVGLPIELPEFTPEQVQDLACRHGLNWNQTQVEKLMAMVGGHPYLVRVALYHIARQEMTLEQLLQLAPTEAGPYSDHLRRHLLNLEQQPELAAALKTVVSATCPVRLESLHVFKLYGTGLVHLHENEVVPSCELYRQYFLDRPK
ncbi:MAG: molecular chaperone Tir [Symploca sp. SIO2E9]|nr:molecular chaperone Tir [Symploca sp. SIO2E9]